MLDFDCGKLSVLGKHDHGDSKLTCIDCGDAICSKCLVQCPVGFRCSKCGNVKNPFTSVSPLLIMRALGICIVIGFGFGHVLPIINLPWIGCFICYFVGLFIGRYITRFFDYKMGRNIGTTIVFGLLIGMALTPLRYLPLAWGVCMQQAFGSGTDVFGGLGCVVSSLFAPAIFIVGILRPTVWGDRC